MINILNEILSKYNIEIQKNPSIYPTTREVKIKLSEGVDEDVLKKISGEFFERTGFYLKV